MWVPLLFLIWALKVLSGLFWSISLRSIDALKKSLCILFGETVVMCLKKWQNNHFKMSKNLDGNKADETHNVDRQHKSACIQIVNQSGFLSPCIPHKQRFDIHRRLGESTIYVHNAYNRLCKVSDSRCLSSEKFDSKTCKKTAVSVFIIPSLACAISSGSVAAGAVGSTFSSIYLEHCSRHWASESNRLPFPLHPPNIKVLQLWVYGSKYHLWT